MTKLEHIEYWKLSSEKDLPTVEILIEKAQYPQALFFGHLVLEKILKAHWVKDNDENAPPKIHNLIKLVNQTNLVFDADDLNFLEIMNNWNQFLLSLGARAGADASGHAVQDLGRVLGDTIREQAGADVFDLVERIRLCAVRYRRDHEARDLHALEKAIGRTALLTITPHLHFSRNDLWEMHELEEDVMLAKG